MRKAGTFLGAALLSAAAVVSGSGTASASTWVDPAEYLVGDTVYFAGTMGGCTIKPNGDVGCDLNGTGTWYFIPVKDLAIDVAFLPAHPTFGAFGRYSRPGAKGMPMNETSMINYAGATCVNSPAPEYRITCDSKGHGFSYGVGGTRVY
ncbi:hypothetical protein JK358_01520 [Nocardia sp. 2]|uniref:Secreted protein n=1 Tax=Nocardia acididurans TaxID=2802282 RepID=A0ABS1LZ58_9NOCA|nr:hypothetical protein [Nocardia acididurans]MBL1073065.1 hypothetical protein [Nocardia acididurans]